jgi:hypothetical protein
MRPLAAAALTLLFFAAGLALSQDKPSEGPKHSTEYFPLKKGAAWTYRRADKTVTVRVADFEKVGDDVCARLEYLTSDNKVTATEAVTVRADGVYRVKADGSMVNPPICFLKLPLKNGQNWKIDSKIASQDVKGGFVEGTEKGVKVPAGTYDTVTVTTTADTQKIDDQTVTITYYFASKVGLVKRVVEIGGARTILELEKYEESKK